MLTSLSNVSLQATTWVEFGILALAIMFNFLSICMYCYGKTKAKEAKRKEKKKALLKAEDEVKPGDASPTEDKIALKDKKPPE